MKEQKKKIENDKIQTILNIMNNNEFEINDIRNKSMIRERKN